MCPGKPQILRTFRRLTVNGKRVTSKWLNISTNKKRCFINDKFGKNGTKLAGITHGVLCNLLRKHRPQWPLPIVLIVWGCGLPKIFVDWKYASHFSAHVSYGQTAGWIGIPLDTEVGLDPGDIVLDGDPAAPSRKGAQQPAPTFWSTTLAHIPAGPHFTNDPYCNWLGSARRAALVAILPDNCQPSS